MAGVLLFGGVGCLFWCVVILAFRSAVRRKTPEEYQRMEERRRERAKLLAETGLKIATPVISRIVDRVIKP